MCQYKSVLEALKYGPLTQREATKKLDVTCLAEKIRHLRSLGHDIETVMIYCKSENGRSMRYGIYYLKPRRRQYLKAA